MLYALYACSVGASSVCSVAVLLCAEAAAMSADVCLEKRVEKVLSKGLEPGIRYRMFSLSIQVHVFSVYTNNSYRGQAEQRCSLPINDKNSELKSL